MFVVPPRFAVQCAEGDRDEQLLAFALCFDAFDVEQYLAGSVAVDVQGIAAELRRWRRLRAGGWRHDRVPIGRLLVRVPALFGLAGAIGTIGRRFVPEATLDQGSDDLFLLATGAASEDGLAVVAVADGEAWVVIVMGWT
jgi:hypothetical protein